MNKKVKILSSVALAGLVALNVYSPRVFAEVEDTIETKVAGIYNQLEGLENENIIAFVLSDSEDVVTFKEIANSDEIKNVTKFNGSAIPNENAIVKTGDTFVANGKTYTVVIYGDVNKDGSVDPNDALLIQQYFVDTAELDEIQQEAADVKNDASIDPNDALYIKKFFVGTNKESISELPAAEEQKTEYTVEADLVASELDADGNTVSLNKIVNKTTSKSNKIVVKRTDLTNLTERKLTTKIIGIDSNGEKLESTTIYNINIPANSTQSEPVEITTLKDFSDGTITIEIYEGDKIVGSIDVTKNTETPEAVNITSVRTSTRKATVSFDINGKDVVKAYYAYKELANTDDNSAAETANNGVFADVASVTKNENVKTTDLTGKTSGNLDITDLSDENQRAVVGIVLEDKYGNQSELNTEVLAKDNAEQEKSIARIIVPELAKITSGDDIEFSWSFNKDAKSTDPEPTGKTFTVSVYKDGEFLESDNNVTELKKSLGKSLEKGKYKITVKVNGTANGTSEDSSVVTSDEIEVKELAKVSNINIEKYVDNKDGKKVKAKLTWAYDAEAEKNVKEYSVQFYKVNKTTGEEETVSTALIDTESDKEAILPLTDKNTLYFAKIIAVNETNEYVSSESEKSAQVFELDTPSVSKIDKENKAKLILTIGEADEVYGKTTGYQLEIYTLTKKPNLETEKFEDEKVPVKTIDVTVKTEKDKDGNITKRYIELDTSDLTPGTQYYGTLIAKVDNETSESDSIDLATPATSPTITNLEKVEYSTVAETKNGKQVIKDDVDATNKIAISGNSAVINNKIYDVNKADYADVNLARTAEVVKNLAVGDVITVEGDTITLTLNGQNRSNIKLGNYSDVTYNITTNDFAKGFTASSVKALNLKGSGIIIDASKVAVTDGITIDGTADSLTTSSTDINVTIEKATDENGIKINGVPVITTAKTTIKVNNKTFTVPANTDITINGVNIVADGNTIAAVDGTKVTITKAAAAEVALKYNVKTKAPANIDGIVLKSKYFEGATPTADELKMFEAYGDYTVAENKATIDSVVKYLEAFKINNENAILTASKDSKAIELKINAGNELEDNVDVVVDTATALAE